MATAAVFDDGALRFSFLRRKQPGAGGERRAMCNATPYTRMGGGHAMQVQVCSKRDVGCGVGWGDRLCANRPCVDQERLQTPGLVHDPRLVCLGVPCEVGPALRCETRDRVGE